MKSKKKQPTKKRSLFKENEEVSESVGKARKYKSVPVDEKEWKRWLKHEPSLLPPKWIQMGMTKEEWEKNGEPKRKKKE